MMWSFTGFMSAFYLAGLGMLLYGLWSMKRSTDAAHWPSTQGKITSCMLESIPGEDTIMYEVKVSYQYTVAGREYSNDSLAMGYNASSGYEVHQEIFQRLDAAKSVRVLYHRDNPQLSTLSFGIHRSIQFVLAFSVTWLLFTGGFHLLWWIGSASDSILLKNLVTQ